MLFNKNFVPEPPGHHGYGAFKICPKCKREYVKTTDYCPYCFEEDFRANYDCGRCDEIDNKES